MMVLVQQDVSAYYTGRFWSVAVETNAACRVCEETQLGGVKLKINRQCGRSWCSGVTGALWQNWCEEECFFARKRNLAGEECFFRGREIVFFSDRAGEGPSCCAEFTHQESPAKVIVCRCLSSDPCLLNASQGMSPWQGLKKQ